MALTNLADLSLYIKTVKKAKPTWQAEKSVELYVPEGVEFPGAGGGGSITVDSELSPTSENPVQNKTLYAVIGDVEHALDVLINGEES